MIDERVLAVIDQAKGFMPTREGEALHGAARNVDVAGPWMEIGTYCGKSALWIGAAAAANGRTLFTIDHHRGSEEMQAGWDHHDESLIDDSGQMDSLLEFRRNMRDADLEAAVVGMVGDSITIANNWDSALALLFIDGGHGKDIAHADYDAWVPKVRAGGTLCIHDVFENPADGGRPPYEIYLRALGDGFSDVSATGSLRVLRKD